MNLLQSMLVRRLVYYPIRTHQYEMNSDLRMITERRQEQIIWKKNQKTEREEQVYGIPLVKMIKWHLPLLGPLFILTLCVVEKFKFMSQIGSEVGYSGLSYSWVCPGICSTTCILRLNCPELCTRRSTSLLRLISIHSSLLLLL